MEYSIVFSALFSLSFHCFVDKGFKLDEIVKGKVLKVNLIVWPEEVTVPFRVISNVLKQLSVVLILVLNLLFNPFRNISF